VPGFLKAYLQDIFLPRGIAVVYVNKRDMGDSTGNWINNTIEGRSSDIQAVADLVRTMPQIDVDRVGYAGHSQGG
jgi:pimeloyl-ACP methyl ester carboxylesterase